MFDNEKVEFQMKIRTKPCLFCGDFEQETECVSSGMFCSMRPILHDSEESDYVELLDGTEMLMQSLRMKCVHMILQESSDDKSAALAKSLDYMLYFRTNCTEEWDFDDIEDFDCSNAMM